MSNITLYPGATVTSTGWAIIGSLPSFHTSLADNSGVSTGAGCGAINRYIEVKLDDLVNDLSIPDGATITSVQGIMEAGCSDRSQTAVIGCSYRDDSGNVINSYTENITVSTTGYNTAYAWTERTTSDGSTEWKTLDINNMRLRVTINTPPSSGTAQIYYLYLYVFYTPTYTSDDNSDIALKNGLMTLKNGITVIK